MRQLLAAWLVVDEQDLPMNPRLLGKPGVGKTTLAYAAAKRLGRDVYILQATRRHAAGRPAGHAGDRRRRAAALRRLAAGHRHAPRRHRHPRRRQPHEREELGQPGAAARQPPLRGIDRRRHQDQGASAFPPGGHHERRRLHLRPARVHPLAPAAADPDRLSRSATKSITILKENLPFADEHILNYVTDFLQQAHAADERYTVRDGINIARFAMKLKSLATRAHARDARRCEIAIIADAGRRSAALCPAKLDLPIPDPGSLTRGRFTLFPGGARAAGIRRRSARRRSCATGPRWSRVELPASLQHAYLRAVDAAAGDVGDRLPRRDGERGPAPSTFPSSPPTRSPKPSAPALEIGAEIVFVEPDAGERPHLTDAYPDPYAIRHIGLDTYVEAYRVYPQPRSEEIAAHAAGIAWKLQGADPLAQRAGGGLAEPARPVLDAMEEPQAQPWRARAAKACELLNPHPGLPGRDHRRVSVPAGALRALPRLMTRRRS